MRDVSHRITKGTPCGLPEREGSVEKRWRTVGGGAFQVDGLSAPGQVGGDILMKKESEAALKGEKWGSNIS